MEDRRQKLLDADSAVASVNAAPTPPTPVVHSPLRWLLAPAFAMNMFCNHWCRDSFGALQVPLETHANLTSTQYNSISSAYFVPNVFMPIIAGVIASCEPRKNGGHTFLAVSLLAAVGNIIVFYGAYQLGKVDTSSLYVLFFAGRLVIGSSYEALDFLPTGMIAHRFPDHWGKMVGFVNGFNRLGSILNFIVVPWLYNEYGLSMALYVSSVVGACCLLTGLTMHQIDRRLWTIEHARPEPTAPGDEPSATSGTAVAEETTTAAEGVDDRLSCRNTVLCNPTYWLYVVGAMCIYGSVVPFWFIGAKILQLKFNISLRAADAMVLLPEGTILVVGPIIGVITDRYKMKLVGLLLLTAATLALIPTSLLMLAWLPLPSGAVVPVMVCLGVGYAASQNLIWTMVPHMLPQSAMMTGMGIMACGLNLLPTVLPVLAFKGNGKVDLTVLAVVGLVGLLAFLVAAVRVRALKEEGRWA